MGGQACVFYGAAEFSRDLDLLILAEGRNLANLRTALSELQAEPIAVPPFDERHLLRGHAIHFRCQRSDVLGLRIDIMSTLRGVGPFEELWVRRTTIEAGGENFDLLGIEDLVRAKKTQQDKDWPMIRRLVEQSYFASLRKPSSKLVDFWLREMRTAELLVEVAAACPEQARVAAVNRPAVRAAMSGATDEVETLLDAEEKQERRPDREYWEPLKRELEQLRRNRPMLPSGGAEAGVDSSLE
jgi:hypothetical protein